MIARIGLFGGTFNPVHQGHLIIAEAARQAHRLSRVYFVPAGIPPHKIRPRTSSQHRLAMLRLAVRGNPGFKVSDWEIRQKRVVYTYQTLEHFQNKWPRAQIFFILGSDSMKNLPKWRESPRLKSLARFIPYERIDCFASHEIRRRVRQQASVRYLVPDAVARYINGRRLYRHPE